MRPFLPILLLSAAIALAACGDSKPPAEKAKKPVAAAVVRKPDTATGTVIRIEDNGYPLFTVTLALPGEEGEMDLLANDGELNVDGGIGSLQGKKVEIAFHTVKEPSLGDMLLDDESILGEDAPGPAPEGQKSVIGRLSGADSDTTSDLPDTITVTPEDGEPVQFKYYITPEMVAANGKTVEVLYDVREMRQITSIKPL